MVSKRVIFGIALSTTMATKMAITNPPSTSVGKCTNKYNLENPMSVAIITAGIPIFLLFKNKATAATILLIECPDGNECP